MSYLLDTDIVIEYLKGTRRAVELVNGLRAEGLAISLVTYGEVYEGVYFGTSVSSAERGFRTFLRDVDVLQLNRAMMRRFGQLRGALRRSGLLIPDPDLLIAVTALHHDLVLVTRNVRHFERVPDLLRHPLPDVWQR